MVCVKVISALTGEEDEAESRSRTHHQEPSRRTNSEIDDDDDDDEDEYNETKYLNDMDRHKQIAFDFQNQ